MGMIMSPVNIIRQTSLDSFEAMMASLSIMSQKITMRLRVNPIYITWQIRLASKRQDSRPRICHCRGRGAPTWCRPGSRRRVCVEGPGEDAHRQRNLAVQRALLPVRTPTLFRGLEPFHL